MHSDRRHSPRIRSARLLSRIGMTVVLAALAACGQASPHSAGPVATTQLVGATGSLAGLTFYATPYTLGAWPDPRGPYYPRPSDYDGARDASGVRIVIRGGITYQHPVAQAMDGLWALAVYYNSKDADTIKLASADAQRLVDTHTQDAATGDAWWFPYPFDFPEYGMDNDTARAPWYSGMAQGQALDLFTQLYATTGDASWRAAADHAFASFLYPYRPGVTGQRTPWVWHVDRDGYAWIEEYPTPQTYDHTMNGFGFATWGLISYARTFGDKRATTLADAVLTTFLHAAPLVRHPGWISGYSVSHQSLNPYYHGVVTDQLAVFAAVTGDGRFAAQAAAFADDFPIWDIRGSLDVLAGTQTIASADTGFNMKHSTSITLPAGTSWQEDEYAKLRGQGGFWYHLTSGPYAGEYLREGAGAHLPGAYNNISFGSGGIAATFSIGTYTLYQLTNDGAALVATKVTRLDRSRTLALAGRLTIAGITVWRLANSSDAAMLGGTYLADTNELQFA